MDKITFGEVPELWQLHGTEQFRLDLGYIGIAIQGFLEGDKVILAASSPRPLIVRGQGDSWHFNEGESDAEPCLKITDSPWRGRMGELVNYEHLQRFVLI